jgi:hypothetical protein
MRKFRQVKYLLILFLSLMTTRAPAPGLNVIYIIAAEPIDPFEVLVNAIVQVESLGDPLAFNPIEEAVGAFQIRPIRVRDYNQRTGKNIKIESCYSYEVSKEIFIYYARLTGYPHYETIARNWNGSGVMTTEYWRRVKSYL